MKCNDISALPEELVGEFAEHFKLQACDVGKYAHMKYPKILSVMNFKVKQYAVPKYGNIFYMYTRAMGGVMQLVTLVFTPNVNRKIPLLLVDMIIVGKKRLAFVEYYDLTQEKAQILRLKEVWRRYKVVLDYDEKPAWYITERTPYSLIKSSKDLSILKEMLIESVKAYSMECTSCFQSNIQNSKTSVEADEFQLDKFIERMVYEGNPSTATLSKVLGTQGAEEFFRHVIMPVVYKQPSKEEE